ncbi:hypothetical protein [Chitinophaga deserti]|uniref:hypothetical protein n=1 Tax=Chitinophaga deserti TaxID=2164099 RepID=UPI000D6AE931|nr:hypothetical protein [Chitinophaga deserti]
MILDDPAIEGKEPVPAQQVGNKTNDCQAVTLPTTEDAEQLFRESLNRLLEVNKWKETSEKPLAAFQLSDAEGSLVDRKAAPGDYIRIRLPGPGNPAGDGFDWVVIEDIIEQLNIRHNSVSVTMRVRPAPEPAKPSRQISHFFRRYATSSFMVELQGRTVKACVFGRNEVPNTEVKGWLTKLRNLIVSFTAMLGFSHFQWKSLVNGILGIRK